MNETHAYYIYTFRFDVPQRLSVDVPLWSDRFAHPSILVASIITIILTLAVLLYKATTAGVRTPTLVAVITILILASGSGGLAGYSMWNARHNPQRQELLQAYLGQAQPAIDTYLSTVNLSQEYICNHDEQSTLTDDALWCGGTRPATYTTTDEDGNPVKLHIDYDNDEARTGDVSTRLVVTDTHRTRHDNNTTTQPAPSEELENQLPLQ